MFRSVMIAAGLALSSATAQAQVAINDSEITRPPVAANGIQYVLKVRVPQACRAAGVTCRQFTCWTPNIHFRWSR